MLITPEAFRGFKCTAESCTDNCCIGWEIDIDPYTLDKYENTDNAFTNELLSGITDSEDGSVCFKLKENGRCAFLNENNLCKIQLNLGEPMLCDICREHPRFYNEYGDICECGFGLCCEEAARLLFESDGILPSDIYTTNVSEDEAESFEEERFLCAVNTREKLFSVLYDEENSLDEIFEKCLVIAKTAEEKLFEKRHYGECAPTETDLLLSIADDTEPIDERWTSLITEMRKSAVESEEFSKKLLNDCPERASEYKKLLSYLFYRHIFPVAFDGEVFARTRFCVDYLRLQMLFDGFTYFTEGKFTKENGIDNTKYLSKQIEYSLDNIEILLFSVI